MRIYLTLLLCLPSLLLAKPGYNKPWGKDANLRPRASNESPEKKEKSPLAFVAKKAIEFHQEVISPIDGPRSNFRPTSARFTLLAIQEHGFVRGFVMGCDRLLRENDDPWHYRLIEIDGKLYKYDPATSKRPPLRSP